MNIYIKEKIDKILKNRFFIPCLVIFINAIFFIICNLLFQLRFETIDDFNIIKIISKLDGTYSYYAIHIHPILSFIIMLLYKTGINVNLYTIVLLSIEFFSFTVIGIIFLNKNLKFGTLIYLFIINTIYFRLLLVINYTSIAAISILAGLVALMYGKSSKKYTVIGYTLIIIGTMLRWKSAIIPLPFYILYCIYYTINNKDSKMIKKACLLIFTMLIIVVSNDIIYKVNPIYKKYKEFNDIRTYFFDFNVMNYEANKETFDKVGWTYEDWQIFYTYSFADENFYNIDNLKMLKRNINSNFDIIKNKILYTSNVLLYITTQRNYLFLFLGVSLILLISVIFNKNKKIILLNFLLYILINFILCYTKPMYRVLVPLYATTFVIMMYLLLEENFNCESKNLKIKVKFIIICTLVLIVFNNIYIYKINIDYNKNNFSKIKEIIEYTNENKQNAYVYPNVLNNISLAYSIYEKIPDDTFSNLRHMGDWDIYNNEYYEFKNKYSIENIITDLYLKDNLYIISGSVYGADNMPYENHIEVLKKYIKEHYNVNVKYNIVKQFTNSVKIYKLYKEE